jgi:hypothetical protein
MSKSHSRRATLAGIATAPALDAPALALSGTGPDPIFAAIEQHRVAFADWGRLPEESEAEAAAINRTLDLETALIETQPSTMAGILAIMQYRRDFDIASPGYHLFPETNNGGKPMSNWLATIEQAIATISGGAVS